MPFLLSANTVNYAVPYKLSCAEALSASLFIAGYKDQANELLMKFKWGSNFITLNEFAYNIIFL